MNVNVMIGWALAVIALALGYTLYGPEGLALGVTMIVFWLLLQFSRAVRVMRGASASPVGMVPSAVMLHTKLKPGLTMLELVKLARSLGEQVGSDPEVWRWRDEGGAAVRITLRNGKVTEWALDRPGEPEPPAPAA